MLVIVVTDTENAHDLSLTIRRQTRNLKPVPLGHSKARRVGREEKKIKKNKKNRNRKC